MFLLLCSSFFVRRNWQSPDSQKISTYPLAWDWKLETPYDSQFLAILSYLLLVLVLFGGRRGWADWFLAVFLGVPSFPESLPIVTLHTCSHRSFSLHSHHFLFLGTLWITRLRPLWYIGVTSLLSFLLFSSEVKASLEHSLGLGQQEKKESQPIVEESLKQE